MTRIKITGKTKPLVDAKKVAVALGAEEVISSQKQTRDGRKYVEIVRFALNRGRNKKRIYELDKKDAQKYALLGTAEGENLFHCVYIAARHVKNFWQRVCGYRVGVESLNSISFYEKR